VADHRSACDLAERTDMRQARWSIAGFKDHGFRETGLLIALEDFLCLFKRPRFRFRSRRGQSGRRCEVMILS
jgi:hypothetical protein